MKDKRAYQGRRLKLGKDGDGGNRKNADVLDLTAPIYQEIMVTDPDESVTIPFAKHTEKVSKKRWFQLITGALKQLTQVDVAIRSVMIDNQERLIVAFVEPQTSCFNTLVISPKAQKHVLWTGYFLGAQMLVRYIRHYVSQQKYHNFTFGMYGYLRLIADPAIDLNMIAKGGQFQLKGATCVINQTENRWLQTLQQHHLISANQHTVKMTALGLSMLNYFARFYEENFQAVWQSGLWPTAIVQQPVLASAANQQRKQIHLPTEVLTNDR